MFRDVPECSGMFRHVPECSMFRLLSTALLETFSRTCDVRHVGILFSLRPGFEKKKSVVFFSFVVRFRLVILFYSYFSICWLDFSPTSDFPKEATIYSSHQAFLISLCNLIFLLVSHGKINCCFTIKLPFVKSFKRASVLRHIEFQGPQGMSNVTVKTVK